MSPLSPDQLVEVARSHYPSEDSEGETPELRRFQEAWAPKLADGHRRWQAMVTALRAEVSAALGASGAGLMVGDTTTPYMAACERLCVYLPPIGGGGGTQVQHVIVGCASVLAPYHLVYGVDCHLENGKRTRCVAVSFPLSGDPALVARLVAKRLHEELGCEPFPARYLEIPVPGIRVGNLQPGTVKLVDALFDGDRENLP